MPPKLKGFEFYEKTLKSAKYVLAPMVDASELAWRMLARRYGAHLCYTPMWHSGVFIRDERYRKEALQTCPEDRPLIVQFCANDPETFKKAVELTLDMIEADAVDLNLGCPQVIAKRGHFGSFLQDEWDLLKRLVSVIHDNFEIPITCKMRVFEDLDKTIRYAQMLESAGCQLLTVHGRTREQKGEMTGLASWKHIAAVVKAVKVPVFANGNIQYFQDIERCIKSTGVKGVMSAEGHLTNPALFSGKILPVWQPAEEYLDLTTRYPCPLSYTRGHLFKLLHHVLQLKENFDVREIVAKAQSLDEFRNAVSLIKSRYEHHNNKLFDSKKLPPWICQPYVRLPPEEHLRKMKIIQENEKLENRKRKTTPEPPLEDGKPKLSKKKMKQLLRNPNKKFTHTRRDCKICLKCPNPCGTKCENELCRKCCISKCFGEELDCLGHKITVKSKREKAREYERLVKA